MTLPLARFRSAAKASSSKLPSSVSYDARRASHSVFETIPDCETESASKTTSVASVEIGSALSSRGVAPTEAASAFDLNGRSLTFSSWIHRCTRPLRLQKSLRIGVRAAIAVHQPSATSASLLRGQLHPGLLRRQWNPIAGSYATSPAPPQLVVMIRADPSGGNHFHDRSLDSKSPLPSPARGSAPVEIAWMLCCAGFSRPALSDEKTASCADPEASMQCAA
eukprot:6212384-Pleurochrysis_carterae.AAC.2